MTRSSSNGSVGLLGLFILHVAVSCTWHCFCEGYFIIRVCPTFVNVYLTNNNNVNIRRQTKPIELLNPFHSDGLFHIPVY